MTQSKDKITTSINFTSEEVKLLDARAKAMHINRSALIRILIFPKLEKGKKSRKVQKNE